MRMHDIFCIDLKEKKDIPQNDYFQTGWSWFICSMNLCTACKKWKLATLKLLFLETEKYLGCHSFWKQMFTWCSEGKMFTRVKFLWKWERSKISQKTSHIVCWAWNK